jgi:GTP cyclohydrolase I
MKISDHVRKIIELIGEDPERDGLKATPERVEHAYKEMFSGYFVDVTELIRSFDNEELYDEMIISKDISFFSTCEHHMAPFFGKAHIAYIPKPRSKIIGVSKLARILEVYTRRLQIQERIGQQVVRALDDNLDTRGSACILNGQHFCVMARGVRKETNRMITSSLTGVFKNSTTKTELLQLINN